MPNNLVTGGLGCHLIIGGLAGDGIPDGSTHLIQNPGFEVAGSTQGDASNWTTDIVSTESEYATFGRPGLDVVTTQIPAQQPTLGFSITSNIDGTITITQSANTNEAQEDFEEGWHNNEQFLFALPAVDTAEATFENRFFESFEGGWLNDPGLENNLDTLSIATATFSYHLDPHSGVPTVNTFENYEGFWPTNATGPFILAIPNVVFGTTVATTALIAGSYTSGSRIVDSDVNGFNQYADVLQFRLTNLTKTPFTISITYVDMDELHKTTTITIPQDLPAGYVVTSPDTVLTGIRYIVSFTPDGTYGYPGLSLEGDPGVAFDEGTSIELDSFVRAKFEGPIVGRQTAGGAEDYHQGWPTDTFSFTFADAQLDPGGFEWLVMGTLNTGTNTYTAIAASTLPTFGLKLVVTVTTTIGVSVSPITITPD